MQKLVSISNGSFSFRFAEIRFRFRPRRTEFVFIQFPESSLLGMFVSVFRKFVPVSGKFVFRFQKFVSLTKLDSHFPEIRFSFLESSFSFLQKLIFVSGKVHFRFWGTVLDPCPPPPAPLHPLPEGDSK